MFSIICKEHWRCLQCFNVVVGFVFDFPRQNLAFNFKNLQMYPDITSFEGLASGVAALVRHLPAGSPAIFYCIHSLVGKAADLCRKALSEDPTLWKTWEGNSGPPKKVLDLLLRLIYLVDIQVCSR